jgi:hypothetical protein
MSNSAKCSPVVLVAITKSRKSSFIETSPLKVSRCMYRRQSDTCSRVNVSVVSSAIRAKKLLALHLSTIAVLDFVMATSTTGEHLAELLIETLQSAGVNIAKMRAQGYDANMSGKYNGVQARILNTIPGATYVHCKSHCLNLAIIHSCKDNSVRNVMTTV